MSDAKIVNLIRGAFGLSLLEAKAMVEKQGATERTPTKRELFAAMAMQGILSAGPGWPDPAYAIEVARRAVIHADALLADLNKEQSE